MEIPFVQARHFGVANRTAIDLIVIHDMETAETLTVAEAVANYFATTSTIASAHYNIDVNSIVQSVRDKDIAYHAPGANHDGLGIEHAGRASQRREEWLDAYSRAELILSAELVRGLCAKYSIPIAYINAAGLQQNKRGITTHNDVSLAFRKSSHTDPGPGFPMDFYLDLVRNAAPNPPAPAPTHGGTPVANAPFAAILVHPNGGYLEIGTDGGVFAWGGAPFFGSLGSIRLNQPIVDAQWTPDHKGYFLLGRDGGIFAFGNARHAGNALYSGA